MGPMLLPYRVDVRAPRLSADLSAGFRPNAAARGAIAIFLIAATRVASHKLEVLADPGEQVTGSYLTAALLHGVTLTAKEEGDARGKRPSCTTTNRTLGLDSRERSLPLAVNWPHRFVL